MRRKNRRKLFSFLEAFLSPIAGLAVQIILYALMGVEFREVSIVFVVVFWVIISAATAIMLEGMEFRHS